MNPEAQEELNRILQMNPSDLSVEEKAFLNARRTYLNNEQRRVFASVIDAAAAEVKHEELVTKEEQEPARRPGRPAKV